MIRRSYLKKLTDATKITVDSDTGELLSEDNKKQYKLVLAEQEFIFVYERFLLMLSKLSEPDVKVFVAICFNSDMKTHQFRSDKLLADQISEKTGISSGTVFNAITHLCKEGLIIRDKKYKNVYTVHPDFGWKGNSKERPKTLELILTQMLAEGDVSVTSEYDENNKIITVSKKQSEKK